MIIDNTSVFVPGTHAPQPGFRRGEFIVHRSASSLSVGWRGAGRLGPCLVFRFVSPLSHGHLHFLLLLFIFGSSGLDKGPGEDIDPLKEPLGCSNGMLSSKFQPWDLPECPAGSAAANLRDKNRDTFARIENMDTVKQLAVPKSSRLLVEERPTVPPDSFTQTGRQKPAPLTALNENVKGETSFWRLSDVLHPGQNSIGRNKGPVARGFQ